MPVSLAAPPAGLSRARSTGINCQCAISRTILSETFSLPRWAGAHPVFFLRGCRPDIAYQVGALTRVTHFFNDEHHISAARHLLRCLRTTHDLQLVCTRNPDRTNRQPELWVDADYCPDYGGWADNHRSTTAWLVVANGAALNWCSRRQQRIAQSSTESEYYAAAKAVKEAARLQALHHDLGRARNWAHHGA